MLTREEVLAEHMRVCRMISDRSISDGDVHRAIELFAALDAPTEFLAECMARQRLTMEQRSPEHLPAHRR